VSVDYTTCARFCPEARCDRIPTTWTGLYLPTCLQQAELLYGGPLLADFSLPSSPVFEEWQSGEQRQFADAYLQLVLRLIDEKTVQNELNAAIAYARRYLHIDPLDETVHRRLMELLALNHERNAALAQYAVCERMLRRELDVEPAPETTALYRAVRDQQFFATPRSTARTDWTTLPSLQTPLFGREEAMRTLQHAYRRVRSGVGRIVLAAGGRARTPRLLHHARTA